MPSDVPDVMRTRSAETGTPRGDEIGGRGLARAGDTRRRGVAVVPVAHRFGDRLDQMWRGQEAEGDGVADVEVADRTAGGLYLLRLGHHLADGIGEAADARCRADGRARRGGGHDRRILAGRAGGPTAAGSFQACPNRPPAPINAYVRCRSVQPDPGRPGRLYSAYVRVTPFWVVHERLPLSPFQVNPMFSIDTIDGTRVVIGRAMHAVVASLVALLMAGTVAGQTGSAGQAGQPRNPPRPACSGRGSTW